MQIQMIIWFSIVTVTCTVGIFYIGKRLITPMQWTARNRRIAWIILSVIFLFPVLSMMFTRVAGSTGSAFAWVTYVGLGFISFVFFFLLMRDILLGAERLFRWTRSKFFSSAASVDTSRRQFLVQSSNLAIIGGAAAATSYGIYEARKTPGIVKVDIPIARLPEAFDGTTIAQISDIHAGLTVDRAWIETIVDEVNQLTPDLIAFTGDMVDGSVAKLKDEVAPFASLRAPLGKFFTTGNHEYYSGAPEWIRHASTLGFDVLMNEHRVMTKEGESLVIAGVTDYSAGQFHKDHISDPVKAIAGAETDSVKILMAHQPRTLHKTDGTDFDLILHGHTHGGQFFPWNYFATLGQPFIKGLHRWNNALVYVSKGTGYWGPPVRLGARSEITLLTLKKA